MDKFKFKLPKGYSYAKDVKRKDYFKTMIPALNLIISGKLDGGIPESGILQIAGPSDSYKSILGLICLRAYLISVPDGVAVIYDTEGGVGPEYLESCGLSQYVEEGRIIVYQVGNVEKMKNEAYNLLDTLQEEYGKILLLLDGIGMVASTNELANASDDKTTEDMKRSKAIKSLFRVLTGKAMEKKCPVIVINHTYDSPSQYEAAKLSGGGGSKNSSEVVLICTKTTKKDEKEVSRDEIRIENHKSRIVSPKSKVVLCVDIANNNGIQLTSNLYELAVSTGNLVVSGSWITAMNVESNQPIEFEGKTKWQGKAHIEHNKAFWKHIIVNSDFKENLELMFRLSKRKPLLPSDEEGII